VETGETLGRTSLVGVLGRGDDGDEKTSLKDVGKAILGGLLESAVQGEGPGIAEVRVEGASPGSVELVLVAPDLEGRNLHATALDADGEPVAGVSIPRAAVRDGAARLELVREATSSASSRYLAVYVQGEAFPFGFRMPHSWGADRLAGSGGEMPGGDPADGPSSPPPGTTTEPEAPRVVRARLAPADPRTRSAVKAASRARAHPGLRSLQNVRLTNQSGWYDILVDVRAGSEASTCRDACFATDGCTGHVVGRGFCGLIRGQLARRYDRRWVQGSRGFTSYYPASSGEPLMTTLRAVGLIVNGNLLSRSSAPVIRSVRLHGSGADRLFQCAEACVLESRCENFVFRQLGSCQIVGTFQVRSRAPASDQSFEGLTQYDVVGGVATFSSLSNIRAWREKSVETGVGLFNQLATNFVRNKYPNMPREHQARFDGLSAAVFPRDREAEPFIGEEPPATSGSPGPIDLQGFVVGADADVDVVPFADTVLRTSDPGTAYFLPRAYRFSWNPSSGRLGGSQFFNAAGSIASGEGVRIQVELSGSYTEEQLTLFQKLVNAKLAEERQPAIERLTRFPVEPGAVRADLGSTLAAYGVGADAIQTLPTAGSVAAPVDLAFHMTDVAARNLLETLASSADQSLGGKLYLTADRWVPIVLDPRDARTYGGEDLEGSTWSNPAPTPVRVRQLHMLRIKPDKAEVLSWNVDAEPVPVGGTLEIGEPIPPGLAAEADRVWLSYDVDPSCRDCFEAALGLGAVSSAARSRVEFQLGRSLQNDFEIDQVIVSIRSRYFDPEDDSVKNGGPVLLDAEHPTGASPELYLPEDRPLDSDRSSYTYRATLYTLSGERHCTSWVPSGAQVVFLVPGDFTETGDACR
jgi:hypothetical protein